MRYKIVNKFRFISFLVICFLLIAMMVFGIVNIVFSQEKEEDIIVCRKVVIKAGDTLWDIAKTYGPEKQDIRFTVFEICKLNNISAEVIKPGDEIMVPCR